MSDYVFSIPGIPKGQARPRFARMGKFVRTYDPTDSVDWKSKVAVFARQAGVQPMSGLVSIVVTAYLPRPKRLMRKRDPEGCVWAGCKPDADNLLKGVQDALTGIAYADDSAIVSAKVEKLYHSKAGVPKTVVELCEMSAEASVDELKVKP